MSPPVAVREVDRRGGRRDVERDAVVPREHREPVRADLVRDVAVRGDAVRADDDEVDRAARHQRRGRDVGDERRVDAESVELPRGEPRALQHRSRLVDPDVHALAALDRAADDAERGAVADARERARVAVREDAARRAARRPRRARRCGDCARCRRRRCVPRSRARRRRRRRRTRRARARRPSAGSLRSAVSPRCVPRAACTCRACARCAPRARRRTRRPRRARARRVSRAMRSRRTARATVAQSR